MLLRVDAFWVRLLTGRPEESFCCQLQSSRCHNLLSETLCSAFDSQFHRETLTERFSSPLTRL